MFLSIYPSVCLHRLHIKAVEQEAVPNASVADYGGINPEFLHQAIGNRDARQNDVGALRLEPNNAFPLLNGPVRQSSIWRSISEKGRIVP